MARGNPHHIRQLALLQAQPEGSGITVSGVRDHQGNVDAPRPGLVDHVQGQLPLLHMPHPGGNPAAAAAGDLVRIGLRRVGIPGCGQEQPPVDGRGGTVIGQVQRDAHLAFGDLARGAGVLPRHTRRGIPVLQKAGVIHDQRFHADRVLHPPGQPGPHMRGIPRAGSDEVRQRLPVAVLTQTSRHRLHRLAPPVQQQPAHIRLPPPPLIRTEEPVEQLRRERLQILPDRGHLLRCHTRSNDTHRAVDTHPQRR